MISFFLFLRDLHNFIVQMYIEKRKMQNDVEHSGYMYITPRTLLGIIRCAQGLVLLVIILNPCTGTPPLRGRGEPGRRGRGPPAHGRVEGFIARQHSDY